MEILIWYSIITGIATIIWLAMSGGVITAANINTITNAYFLLRFKNSGLTKPIFVR